ncbi:MAG: helix-turn-helix transcriptional regulator [Lachnospiraceae bacterium]|nr:helix-turn-helix transcriptional regulator [Lachnospiraceae bacterium]
MNIKTSFLKSLTSAPKLSSGHKPEEFLGHIYSEEINSDSKFLRILSGGIIQASSPYSFDIRSLDCYMLLYTKSGCGKLLIQNQVYTLMQSSLLFLDCHERFRLDIAIAPWEYQILFITGNQLKNYYDLLPGSTAIMPLLPYSETALCLEKLSVFDISDQTASVLSASSLLNTIITGCVVYQLADNSPSQLISSYLNEMKELFDTNFQENYSLDDLEERFHISKYRLCREFGAAFHMPPLQYLNRKRIEVAKHLLLTTSLKVHEVGSRVGIDNTNHFISLFKKFTGQTPLEYKQNKIL